MIDRDVETTLLPTCADNNISCLSYSSLALGLLSGKMGPERTFEGDDQRKDSPRFSLDNRKKITNLFEEIKPIAEGHSLTIAQLVIAWTLSQPGITFALCGARNPEQAIENAKAGCVRLNESDISDINRSVDGYLKNMDG